MGRTSSKTNDDELKLDRPLRSSLHSRLPTKRLIKDCWRESRCSTASSRSGFAVISGRLNYQFERSTKLPVPPDWGDAVGAEGSVLKEIFGAPGSESGRSAIISPPLLHRETHCLRAAASLTPHPPVDHCLLACLTCHTEDGSELALGLCICRVALTITPEPV